MSPPKLSAPKAPGCPPEEDYCFVVEKLQAIHLELENLNRAFPDGPESHRLAHEAMIRAAAAEERFWNELKLDIAKKGAWGLLIIVCGLALVGFAAKFGISAVMVPK